MTRIEKIPFFTVSLLLLLCIHTRAQSQTISDTGRPADTAKKIIISQPAYRTHPKYIIKRPKPVTKEMSFGARLNSNGWSGFVERGKIISEDERHADMFYNIHLWLFEFSEIKNPKELKATNTELDPYSNSRPTPFIYGKINNFYTIKLGYGFRKMIAGKPDPGTVAIHWIGTGGLSVGLLKPYYINAIVNGSQATIRYVNGSDPASVENNAAFLSQTDIVGSAGFSQGLNEIKIIPGLFAKTGLHFDFSANRKTVLAVEAGINGEIYTQAIPLMANQKAVPYFTSLYVSFQFGKRW